MHPTREKLIDTMATLLDSDDPEHITAEQVLTISGISKGSLYHHFADFEELLEAALISRFIRNVDASVSAIAEIVLQAQTKADMQESLRQINIDQQRQDRMEFRLERARAAGLARSSERFKTALGLEQQRVTDAFTDLIREGQNKGWFSQDIDPHAAAVFTQAYTLGRVVDDIAPKKVDQDKWIALINLMLERMLFV